MDPRQLLSAGVHVGTCLKLSAALALKADVLGTSADATARAGACVCLEADVGLSLLGPKGLLDLGASVDAYVQLDAGVAAHVAPGRGDEVKAAVSRSLPVEISC